MTKSNSQYISKAEVRKLFLIEQGFGCNQTKIIKHNHLKNLMSKLHVLQLDAIPVVARTQYLPAFSRLGIYDSRLLEEIAYEMDHWFECWAHEASLVPVEYEPLFRWSKERVKQGYTWKSLYRFATNEKKYIESVYLELKERGRLKAKDIFDQQKLPKSTWGHYSYASRALDWLFRIGQVGIRRVGNFEKEFDCIENIVPKKIHQQKTPTIEQAMKQLLLISVQALGVATEDEIVDYFRLPPKIAKPYLKQLYEDKKLERWQVESWSKPAFSLPKLPAIKNISMDNVTALLSPFDPVVWHRPRTERLFDFFYRIEIYVPQEKRKWGYYVLPFLMEGDLVARVDIKADRTTHSLQVLAAYAEKDVDKKKVASSLSHELKKMSQWLNLKTIQLGRKGDLMNNLRKEF
ncbi:MAG TPA: crosslink repair DNA glycosylase YcaQ family protein [Oligoflexia bacterium]|nr:crosslink repair DNA glycosylase YcaQ family protein [Oligoflexia bacterium]HMR23990.1 crosslink repair DNA glycosylase YcaQ family protein [Oligoflexia bacterium]